MFKFFCNSSFSTPFDNFSLLDMKRILFKHEEIKSQISFLFYLKQCNTAPVQNYPTTHFDGDPVQIPNCNIAKACNDLEQVQLLQQNHVVQPVSLTISHV